jgi:hypothetical protein
MSSFQIHPKYIMPMQLFLNSTFAMASFIERKKGLINSRFAMSSFQNPSEGHDAYAAFLNSTFAMASFIGNSGFPMLSFQKFNIRNFGRARERWCSAEPVDA